MRQVCYLLLFLGALLCVSISGSLQGADPAGGSSDAGTLKAILGSDPASWTITDGYSVANEQGKPAVTGAGTITLVGKTSYSASTEYQLAFRLCSQPTSNGNINVSVGCATLPDGSKQACSFTATANQASACINYGCDILPETSKAIVGTLFLQAVNERSLAWPDEMRKTIEAQIAAAPKLTGMRCTLRMVVTHEKYTAWLNGRFIGQFPVKKGVDPKGTITISMYNGTELLSLRAFPVKETGTRFEPLELSGMLNASALVSGQRVAKAPFGPEATLDGISFRFPAKDDRGNDHLDLSPSWTRFGALPGYIAANFGSFGGRWVSADRVDPSRFCMYVPRGRYKALHLIAVADGRKDSVPIVTAQFYRPDAGHPFNFAGTVPTLTGNAGTAKAVPVTLANGKSAKLYHVTIPLDPDAFSWFSDLDRIGLEITKKIQYYRGYPDPLEYSWHAAGLPSSVQIYAATLERVGVDVDLQPDQFGHVWTAPAKPGYTIELHNTTGVTTPARLVITTKATDGKDLTTQERLISLPAGSAPVKVPIALKPTRYGLHELTLTVTAAGETASYRRNFAYLHEDTRERGDWEDGHGAIFGFWNWGGGHVTPPTEKVLPLMAAAGCETATSNFSQLIKSERESTPKLQALAEKYQFLSEAAFVSTIMYYTGFTGPGIPGAPEYDPAKPEESGKTLVTMMKPFQNPTSSISRPTYVPFFTEPNLWPITVGTWPTHWGEADYTLNKGEQERYEDMSAKYLAGAKAIRKEWPTYKLLMPYGEPMNTAVFLRLNPALRGLIDGCALDMPGFERLPEQQINQVTFNRLYATMKDLKQYLPNPYLVMTEGFCVSAKDIDTGVKEQADTNARDFLLLMGYGVNRFESANPPNECASYWGENHYGGGLCSRLPVAQPELAYVHQATLTRHLNRANFTKYVSTGSTSTYCEQFKHYQTGKLIHVLWTIRGQRPVNISVAPGATLELYDPQDNVTTLKEKDGKITFTIGQSPCYLEGLTADVVITLGESNHSDAKPAAVTAKLGNLGDGAWKIVTTEDLDYTKNKPYQIERFLGKMNIKTVAAPKAQGSKALAVHLDEHQDKDRGVMPYYTTLEPAKPMTIPGKATHIGLWVKAASDWGRVVYSLRDAKGEKWISVGTKEDWNNDDIHCWSAFCFDGWRYLRFELPSSAPYDSFREYGTSWWGSFEGDGIVDLPLKLEKIIVERRPKVIYGNDLVPAKADDVLLGDLFAEYATNKDKTAEAIRLSQLRMPTPAGTPPIENPIADLEKTGVGAPTQILKVADPIREYNGTRCNLSFNTVDGAKSYDIWVSPYADGRGAMQLGTGWTTSGQLLEGLHPDTDFYIFVVYTDKDGKLSKPSQPLKIRLKNRFVYQ